MPRDDARWGIIKNRQVKMAGTRRLDTPVGGDKPPEQPQARIIDQSGRATAVEVACTCGRKIYLELDHPAEQDAAPGGQEPPPAAPAPPQGDLHG